MKTSIPNEVMGNEKKKTCLHEFERHDGIGNTNKVVLYSPFFFSDCFGSDANPERSETCSDSRHKMNLKLLFCCHFNL